MSQKVFYIGFWLILIFGLLIRIIPALGNNFYFTMDQADDAVNAREILHRHQILLKGPETSISGFYNGSLWYWFSALGYFISSGHPFGPLLLLILLNLGVCAVLMFTLAKKVSPVLALFIGAALQFYWWFYDASRYFFNPFPLVAFSIIEILLLIKYLEGSDKSLILAAIPVGLSFHTELASFPPLFILYAVVVVVSFWKKRFHLRSFLIGLGVLILFFLPHIFTELRDDFPQTKAIANHLGSENNVLGGTNFDFVARTFLQLTGVSILPHISVAGLGLFVIFATIFFIRHSYGFRFFFVLLSLFLWGVSFVWFGSNKGWQEWHTVYIPVIIFLSFLLILSSFPLSIRLLVLLPVIVSQTIFFSTKYTENFFPSTDASLLVNELAAVDWVYQKSQGQGVYVYSYLPSVYDYPYQYLFWWYGRKRYGYVPCEYSTYPGIADIFVPGVDFYQEPKRICSNQRFLIVEPDKNEYLRQKWLEGVRKKTKLIEETKIGTITIEKREIE